MPSILLLMTSHALLAREIRRHEVIERALHDFREFGVAVRRLGLSWLLLNHPPPHPSA